MSFLRKIIAILLLSLNCQSQILNKKFYLIDGLDSSKITLSDFQFLKKELSQYHKEKSDTDRIQTLTRIVEGCYDENIWTKYNDLAYRISLEKKKVTVGSELRVFKESEANCLNNFGYYFYNHTTYTDSALIYYEKARVLNEEMKSIGPLLVSYSNIANVYQNKGDFLKALELYNKVLSLENETKVKTGILSAMNNISNIYMYLGDTTTSLLYLKRCFLLAKESNDKNMKAHLLHNMGAIMARKNPNQGIQSVKTALSIRKQIGDKKGIAQSLLTLSGIALRSNNNVAASMYLKEVKILIDEIQNPNQLAQYHRNCGEIELMNGNKKAAIGMFEIAANYFRKSENINDLTETLSQMIAYTENDPAQRQKHLEFIEEYYKYSKALNKNAAQRAANQVKYDNEIKLREAEQKIKDEKNQSEKRQQRYITITISIILIITLVFCVFIFLSLKSNREKTIVIDKQKKLVEEKQKEVIDSINYSKRIQNSFIPSSTEFETVFPNSFVIYQPKDIVSGDFYWILDTANYPGIKRNVKAIAVADCTGHGVPGAMLSMLGASILNQAILEANVLSAADTINFLNLELKKNLRSKNNEIIRDGMDISYCVIEKETLKLEFVGANNPCWILRDGTITKLKAIKQGVTAFKEENEIPFEQQQFQLQKGDTLFLFTDGFADQFGGPRGKKYMYSRLEQLLVVSNSLNSSEQRKLILKDLEDWKGSLDQVDDVTLIGIKI